MISRCPGALEILEISWILDVAQCEISHRVRPREHRHLRLEPRVARPLFSPPERGAEIATALREYPLWLSPDACRLYFGRSPGGIFVAAKP